MPTRRDCPPLPPPFMYNEGDAWNCNLCGSDMCFFIPYKSGDVFSFALNLPDEVNTPGDNIVAGWKTTAGGAWYVSAAIVGGDSGAVISDNIDEFSSAYFVAYTEAAGSVQNFSIDTAAPIFDDLDCFKIRLKYRRILDGGLYEETATVWSEPFKALQSCEESVAFVASAATCGGAVVSSYTNFLGTGGEAPATFIRVPGAVEFIGADIEETTTDRGIIIKKKKIENYEITAGIVAPYFAKMICGAAMSSESDFAGLQNIVNFTGISKNNNESKNFVLTLQFSTECEANLFGC
ncbi:MAG: hypothetical protein OET79_09065 [Nitrospirota bacterium]|nr:hypothetical protein [Nitrospirota bacterium]